jgi:hypothetical protein
MNKIITVNQTDIKILYSGENTTLFSCSYNMFLKTGPQTGHGVHTGNPSILETKAGGPQI